MTVTLAQAKAQLRVTHNSEDTYIADLITRATAWLERYVAKPLTVTTVVDTFNEFGEYLLLTRGPFVSLTSIGYVNADGDPDTVTVGDIRARDGRLYSPADG